MNAVSLVDKLLETEYRHPDYGEQEKPSDWDDLTGPAPEPFAAEDDPSAFFQQASAKLAGVKSIFIEGRRWWRRGFGGEYCTAHIFINGKFVHMTPEQGGGGDHYLTLAKDWLVRNGYIELAHNEPIWCLRDKQGLDLHYSVSDVKRERDLF